MIAKSALTSIGRREERHENYRPFSKLDRKQQSEYWKWRHEHPEGDWDRR